MIFCKESILKQYVLLKALYKYIWLDQTHIICNHILKNVFFFNQMQPLKRFESFCREDGFCV